MLCLEPRRWVESKFWNKRKCECKVKTAATSDLKSNLGWFPVLASLLHIRPPLHRGDGSHGCGKAHDYRGIFIRTTIFCYTLIRFYVFYPCQVFSTSVPALVTTSFATIYLMSMAAGKFQLEQNLLEGNSALEEFLNWTLRQLCRICWVVVFNIEKINDNNKLGRIFWAMFLKITK